jgi:hypothetical protein
MGLVKEMKTTIETSRKISKKRAITNVVRRKVSNGIFYCNRSKQNKSELFQFGISSPKIIIDRKTDRPCISYIPVRDVFSVKVMKKKSGKGYVIDIPNKSSIHKAFLKRRDNLLLQAENVLLETIGHNLASRMV